jgi:hypothetical protein
LPVNCGFDLVTAFFPGVDFLDESFFIRDSAI